jgi:hypothetical protein
MVCMLTVDLMFNYNIFLLLNNAKVDLETGRNREDLKLMRYFRLDCMRFMVEAVMELPQACALVAYGVCQ